MDYFVQSIAINRHKSNTYQPAFILKINGSDYYFDVTNCIEFHQFRTFVLCFQLQEHIDFNGSYYDYTNNTTGYIADVLNDLFVKIMAMQPDYDIVTTKQTLDDLFKICAEFNVTVTTEEPLVEYVTDLEEPLGFLNHIPIYYSDIIINKDLTTLDGINVVTHNLFNDYISMNVFKTKHSHLDLDDLPNRCECGGEIIVNYNSETKRYSTISCVNPYCFIKYANILSEFLTAEKISGLGVDTLLSPAQQQYFRTIYCGLGIKGYFNKLFNLRHMSTTMGYAASNKLAYFINSIPDYKNFYKTFMANLSFPNIGKFVADNLTKQQILSCNDLLDIDRATRYSSINALTTKYNILFYLSDLKYALALFNTIDEESCEILDIVITGSVSIKHPDGEVTKFKSKEDFIDEVNDILEKAGDNTRLKLQKSVTYSTDICLYNVGTNSAKYNKALNLVGQTDIKLCTPTEFIYPNYNINTDTFEEVKEE